MRQICGMGLQSLSARLDYGLPPYFTWALKMIDWTLDQTAQIAYSYERFAQAKVFIFRKWCELAVERHVSTPSDLSGSCQYGSLFMSRVFGGSICGHYQHQYNIIGGRIVDLSHDAMDVGGIRNPYLHEPDFFAIPEKQAALNECLPRVDRWVAQFLVEIEDAKIPLARIK